MPNLKFQEVNDVSTAKKKGFQETEIPFLLREKLLENSDNKFGHPGFQKLLNLIYRQYYWEYHDSRCI